MSDYPLSPSGGASSGEGAPSTTDTAKERAASVASDAKDQAASVAADVKGQTSEVASHAVQETKQVVDEAKSQFVDLFMQSRSELTSQVNGQQQRLAQGLRSLGEELGEMASSSSQQGMAGQAASQLSGRVTQAADFLEERDIAGVLDEVSDYARRRPGVFLLGSALLGVVAGRVTRGLRAGSDSSGRSSEVSPAASSSSDADVTGVPQVSGPSTTYITSDRAAYGTTAEGPLGSGYGTSTGATPSPMSDPLAYPPGEGEGRTR